ncbi:hypothetical protein CORC01_13911 [Colletotrichum orchidophilum]|uniref:Uncharacterized protein n=1 Tax=Colletotrichum orchidophilum TaxID=1209926 RepID=A0A1G4ANY5_9PEZI|nr:uncharacterized protein CORC01_13911 [Colletotrichum orchidophilum]OHE90805.1 hypothetical protein CORC01_13911 [Colletotrichum orchidophilum]
MVNPNRWSWSAGPRRSSTRGNAVTSIQPLARSPDKPISCEVDVPNDQNLQPGATNVSSRRLTKNRWSWRPDAAISVTLEDQQETAQGERQDREEHNQDQAETDAPTNKTRRLSKLIKKTDAAPLTASRPKRRPSSMIAPASSSFGASPSYSHPGSRAVQEHPAEEEDRSSHASPLPNQPAAGVKNKLNRFLSRHITTRQVDKKAVPVPVPVQHQHQQTPADAAEPPPSSRHQQPTPQRPMPMQPPMRHRLQLHNPQNTLRASPAPPVAHIQTQGYTDNGRLVAPLPGLDENSQLQLPPATSRPATATGAAAAQSLGTSTPSSSTAAPSADETGLLNRLMRRRLAPKDKDADNKKRWTSASSDKTSSSPGIDRHKGRSPGPNTAVSETTEQRETQTRPLLLNPLMLNPSHPTPAQSETVLDARRGSLKSSVPRFLRPATKPQQESTNATQTAGPASPLQLESPPRQQQTMQTSGSAAPTQLKLRSKPSFGKRFWSRSGANDFGEANVTNTKTPAPASAPRTVYVPKHAAADFSRTTSAYTSRHNRHSFSFGNDPDNGAQALATIRADAGSGESEPLHQRQRTPSAEAAEKRRSRDLSSSKYEAPPPHELHRRLEIVKSSEIEVVTTREPVVVDPWQQQHNLLQNASNTSSSNGKAPARPHSRPRSSKRHSFNLVHDPYARELTPPKSISPVEMEAPFDPPSQPEQQPAPPSAPPRPISSHSRPQSRQETQPQETASSHELTDYERFVADAEVAEREYHAQLWRNLARRSGHYGYSDNPWSTTRQADASTAQRNNNNKRSSAQFSMGVGKRASMMSFAAANDDDRNLVSSSFYGEPLRKPSLSHSASVGADGKRGLRHQGSVSKRISDYIKPPKPYQEATYEDWMPPSGRANRRSVIAGISE